MDPDYEYAPYRDDNHMASDRALAALRAKLTGRPEVLSVRDMHIQNARSYEVDAESYRDSLKKVRDEITSLRVKLEELAQTEEFYSEAVLFSDATAKWHAERAELTAEVAE